MNTGSEKAHFGNYTLEKIYDLVGRNDYVSTITFRPNTQSEKLYGNTLTIVFLYTQQEREELEDNIKKGVVGKHGYVRAKYLLFDLPDTKIKLILEPAKLTEEENAVIYDANGKMNEDIAYVYLGYKYVTLNISKEEIIELIEDMPESLYKTYGYLGRKTLSNDDEKAMLLHRKVIAFTKKRVRKVVFSYLFSVFRPSFSPRLRFSVNMILIKQ